jgi:hypothetical protein
MDNCTNQDLLIKARRSPQLDQPEPAKQQVPYGSGNAAYKQRQYGDANVDTCSRNARARNRTPRNPRDRKRQILIKSILAVVSPFILASILLLLPNSPGGADFILIWQLSFGIGFYFFIRTLHLKQGNLTFKRIVAAFLTSIYIPGMIIAIPIYMLIFDCEVTGNCLMLGC